MQENKIRTATTAPFEHVDDLTVERYRAPLKPQRAEQDFTAYCDGMRPGVPVMTAAFRLIH
jgi:hypothetical protein